MPETTDNDYSDKKELLSSFNEAKFQIIRLHSLWQKCNTLSQTGQLTRWKWDLDTIWRELSPDALAIDKNKEDKEKYSTKIKELNENIAKSKGKDDIYQALQEKEIFLRCLQDEVGKGSKRTDRDEDDIDE